MWMLVLLCLLPAVGFAADVAAVRAWPSPEYSRITIEAPAPIRFSLAPQNDAARLVLELPETPLNSVLQSLPAKISTKDPFITRVIVLPESEGSRVLIDLRVAVRPQAFALRPSGDYGHRLVLDIYPSAAEDPLLAFIEELERQQPEALPPTAPDQDGQSPSANPAEQSKFGGTAGQAAAVPPAAPPSTARTTAPAALRPPSVKPGAPSADAKSVKRLITVAIDAGHGGEDPGARGRSGTHEKDITLAIARRLKQAVDAVPNMRGVLIRDGDYFIALNERVNKARRLRADLFVSIHADAFIRPEARGSSVFALSERGATSAAARWLAKKENEADLIGGVNLDVADPYLKQTLLDLQQDGNIRHSIKLGQAVLAKMGDINPLHKPRVEQAGFAVLKAPDIPSILVETAFISNPAEEKKLRSKDHQGKVAQAILSGILHYFAEHPPAGSDRVALR